MTYETIRYEPDGREKFVTITLDRPDKLNAMNPTLIGELEDAVKRAGADPNVNAAILTGAGRAFCAGYDLKSADLEMDAEGWRENILAKCENLLTIWGAPIPIVAAINGFALAGGLELALCCDLAIAAEDARLGEPEVRHASGPPTLMLPWTLPIRHVRYLMYTGDLVDGAEAARMHLVNKAVPRGQLMAEAKRLATKLARMPWPALKFAKASINQQQQLAGLRDSWMYNMAGMAALHASPPGREWTRRLREMPLGEFLALREAPFRDLD